jgi:ribosome maturation factor RimP
MVKHQLEAVTQLAQDLAGSMAMELYHVQMDRQVLRVMIDRIHGATLGDCAEFSRALSSALDREDIIPGRYFLEVTTPGVERQLFRPKDFRAAVGQNVTMRTREWTREGLIQAADDKSVTIVDSQNNQESSAVVPYEDVVYCRVKVTREQLFALSRAHGADSNHRGQ